MTKDTGAGLSAWAQVAIFAAIALLLSWVPYWFVGDDEGSPLTLALTFIRLTSPLLAALILRKLITRQGFVDSGLGVRSARPWIWLVAAALPVAWHGLSLTAGLAFEQVTLDATQLSLGGMLWGLTVTLIWVLPEELGWRGTLLPKLVPLGVHPALLITGLVWYAWHPELVLGAHDWVTKLLYFVDVLLLSYAIGWLYLKGRSVWPCVLLHATHNLLADFTRADPRDSLPAELIFTASLVLIVAGLWLLARPKTNKP